MEALREIVQYVKAHPTENSAKILIELVIALDEARTFSLLSLYELNYEHFELALSLLKAWRLGRYGAMRAEQMHKIRGQLSGKEPGKVEAGAPV